jgi:hypothetical protein
MMSTSTAWAGWVSFAAVMLNALAQLVFLSAFPIWASIIIGVDAVIIWALVAHGDEAGAL